MKASPILFSAPMVRAILDGQKTQTRRLLDLRRSVGTPETPDGCLLQLWYPGAKLHYGYEVDDRDGVQRSWQVQRLCGPGCEPSPKGVYPPTGHVDWRGPVDGYHGPYDGRHPVSWGPLRFWPGLRLWVKETWQPIWASDVQPPHGYASLEGWTIGYVATDGVQEWHDQNTGLTSRCKPSIYMPRAFSRITLEVTAVRIERLHCLTEEDARAEGMLVATVDHFDGERFYRPEEGSVLTAFRSIWHTLNGEKAPWKSNPWVLAVTFRRVSQ